jgi:hypothetical protein
MIDILTIKIEKTLKENNNDQLLDIYIKQLEKENEDRINVKIY